MTKNIAFALWAACVIGLFVLGDASPIIMFALGVSGAITFGPRSRHPMSEAHR